MDLVEEFKKGVYCDSSIVAKKFGVKHAHVVDNIKKVSSDIQGLRVGGTDPKYLTEKRTYRGNDYSAYLMNRDFFSILVMRFKGKRAIIWQLKFIAAFNSMESHILASNKNSNDPVWLAQREIGKQARLEETDVIKEFVDYATAQGSQSAKFYYKHLTTATYSALGLMYQRHPKLRDTLNFYQVAELTLVERQAKLSLKKYMDLGRNYKDIYNSVKEDLLSYGTGLQPRD